MEILRHGRIHLQLPQQHKLSRKRNLQENDCQHYYLNYTKSVK